MKAISDMTYEEIIALVFKKVGIYVGKDATGLAFHAVYNGRTIAGPWANEAIAIYYALCYMAKHALNEAQEA